MAEHSGSLFEGPSKAQAVLPLASRMRPKTLDDYVGQRHLLGEGMPLRAAIEQGALGSVVLWAPPGCGKTTLAHIIASYMNAAVDARSAVTTGVADVRKIAQEASHRLRLSGRPTLLILDEIHHFNRTQQDSLLGYLEDGTLTMVGVTTENPFFVLAPALLSRARVLPLQPLEPEDLEALVRRALADPDRGLGARKLSIEPDALSFLIRSSDGDARLVLNVLEAVSLLAKEGETLALPLFERVLQRKAVRYDQQGDYHYDTISAFIKSVRGSDSDAALHYLARMIEAGEDPRFIMRRVMILASEDVGNAQPLALLVASAAAQAVERLGMPESRIVMAQAVTFLAESPKSNAAYLAIDAALEDVRRGPLAPIPLHLRNAPAEGLKELGHGKDYLYPHDFPEHWVEQKYLPEAKLNTPYYKPTGLGHEAKFARRRAPKAQTGTESTDEDGRKRSSEPSNE